MSALLIGRCLFSEKTNSPGFYFNYLGLQIIPDIQCQYWKQSQNLRRRLKLTKKANEEYFAFMKFFRDCLNTKKCQIRPSLKELSGSGEWGSFSDRFVQFGYWSCFKFQKLKSLG